MSEHGFYTGNDLLNLPPDLSKPLIDGLLWERDVVFLVGKEKSGKSVIAQQMAFALSCGESFLSAHKTKTCPVFYVQVEGKLGQTQERVNDMLEDVSWNPDNFALIFYPGLALNNPQQTSKLIEMIDNKIRDGILHPKLIIFDPLYMCIDGDLCDQTVATGACKSLRVIADRYNCALIMVHHEHRPKMEKGRVIAEGDNSIFGSFVWKAFPDHILCFRRDRLNQNTLTCSTQRSSKVVEKIELNYLGPHPLKYELRGDMSPVVMIVIKHLSKDKDTGIEEICKITEMSYNSIRRALTHLKKEGRVIKMGTSHPTAWRLK